MGESLLEPTYAMRHATNIWMHRETHDLCALGLRFHIKPVKLGYRALEQFLGAMMLDHLGEKEAGASIVQAIERTLAERTLRTRDLGGNADTVACGKAVAELVE